MATTRANYPATDFSDIYDEDQYSDSEWETLKTQWLFEKLESLEAFALTEDEFRMLLAAAHSALYVTTVNQIKEGK